ncbi:hypothetical protein OsJ_18778 [Oryza sativa Japonica Group]|uniref:Uncharacterized protein n=1 Tax=Oryza sativa subsp. japonica TaxID=39947 RepID=B9FPY4_ORYSJ|nr:hypothetical protein OsJ_18778 [Oryza sativa Japonica Group]
MSCGGAGQTRWLLDYGLVKEEIQGLRFHLHGQRTRGRFQSKLKLSTKEIEAGCFDKRSRPCFPLVLIQWFTASSQGFNELSAILEPGKPPRADKVSILSDAARLLSQLRAEAQKLKSSNESLQDSIKSLKAEKSELRDEKTRLKAERERLEQMLKGVGAATPAAPAPFVPHHAAAVAAAPAYHPAAFAQAGGKYVPYATSYAPPAAFWQWIPPTSLDTSKDPVMWPPVA